MAARHSLVTSSTTFRIRKRRPQANWSCTKSKDQRAFARTATSNGALLPTARRRARRWRTVSPSFAVEPIDAVDPRWLALAAQQDEQTPVAETPALIGQRTQTAAQLGVRRAAASDSGSSCDRR